MCAGIWTFIEHIYKNLLKALFTRLSKRLIYANLNKQRECNLGRVNRNIFNVFW